MGVMVQNKVARFLWPMVYIAPYAVSESEAHKLQKNLQTTTISSL